MSEVTLTLTGTMPAEATSSPEAGALALALPGYPAPASPTLHRRSSLEEDYFYRQVMTVSKKPNEPPPSYESTIKRIRRMEREEKAGAASTQAAALLSAATATAAATEAVSSGLRKGKGKLLDSHGRSSGVAVGAAMAGAGAGAVAEELPAYSCDINMEGVFQRKMEIENTTKRAADRRWAPMMVVLRGTALEMYNCRKDRSWVSRMTRGGPGVSPDNPPWLRRGSLEKSYNLAYADTGIASDYLKRRYVIRVRAETDQFLLSCVELETFVRWLDAFFAALSIAAPIDERDFPRDQSIPRLQRIRWYHGRDREAGAQRDGDREMQAAMDGELQRTDSLVSSASASGGGSYDDGGDISRMRSGSSALSAASRLTDRTISGPSAARSADSAAATAAAAAAAATAAATAATVAPMPPLATRLSATNYPHDAVDMQTGKWQPRHRWTATHDMVYAKLCYATLLFRSPRKSNYIVMRGKQWFVDWTTGNMFRVSPPRYGEVELFGPWQVVRTENVRI